jgi:hypothetical protein
MKAENILIEIAQENGFDTWEQYFECFRTTEPGRRVINEGILKAVNQALILSGVSQQRELLKSFADEAMNWWYEISDHQTTELIMKHKILKPIKEQDVVKLFALYGLSPTD